MLHGRTKIELYNNKTHQTKRIVHDNMLTNYIKDLFELPLLGSSRLEFGGLNRNDALGGLLMFNQPLSNDADEYYLPPMTNRMIAHADRQTYSGSDKTRGSFNSALSTSEAGAITNVWDFTQEQGNGTISSVCLADTKTALMGSGTTDTLENSSLAKQAGFAGSGFLTDTESDSRKAVDFENNRLYKFTCANGVLTIKSTICVLLTKFNPLRSNISTGTVGYLVESLRANGEDTLTVDLSSIIGTVSNFAWYVEGTTLYLYAGGSWSNGESKTLVILDLTDGTYTTQTVTNNTGGTLPTAASNTSSLIAIHDGYLYQAASNNKFAFINLSDNTDCGRVALPNGTEITASTYSFCILGNIFIIKEGYAYHSAQQTPFPWSSLAYTVYHGMALQIGLAVINQQRNYSTGAFRMLNKCFGFGWMDSSPYATLSIVPGLATKNNLESAVTKTADMTMRVTYTVTDSE